MEKTVIDEKHNTLHYDPIECVGCNDLFAVTVRQDAYEEIVMYCANCFAHTIGLKQYESVTKSLDKLKNILWHTPANKLSDEVKKQIIFINPEMNKVKP